MLALSRGNEKDSIENTILITARQGPARLVQKWVGERVFSAVVPAALFPNRISEVPEACFPWESMGRADGSDFSPACLGTTHPLSSFGEGGGGERREETGLSKHLIGA